MKRSPFRGIGVFVFTTGTFFFLQFLRQEFQQKEAFVCNEHFLFGIWSLGWGGIFLGGILLFLSLWLARQAKTPGERIGWVIIALGGFSNLFERIYFGCVIDYLFLPFWPSFNLADILLCLGAGSILFVLFLKKN